MTWTRRAVDCMKIKHRIQENPDYSLNSSEKNQLFENDFVSLDNKFLEELSNNTSACWTDCTEVSPTGEKGTSALDAAFTRNY